MSASASPATARSAPTASTAASTASAFDTQWSPRWAMVKVSSLSISRAVTRLPPLSERTAWTAATSASPPPKVTMRSAWRRAALSSRSRWGVSSGMIATPSGSSPSKISALASAIASIEPRCSICAEAMVVISATCGPHQPGQRGDLAGMVHAHFEHREFAVARHPRQAERHAGVVVVAFDRAVDLAAGEALERRRTALPWSRSCRPIRSRR